MAIVEDAASVMEQFVQDSMELSLFLIRILQLTNNTVANVPPELAHLYEEMEAKDRIMQECKNTITRLDASIQKFLKMNGARQVNPKEEGYVQTISSNYDKLERIQDEKVALSEKAAILVSVDTPLLCHHVY